MFSQRMRENTKDIHDDDDDDDNDDDDDFSTGDSCAYLACRTTNV